MKQYELTEPRRKSVNPWDISKKKSGHYTVSPHQRPWGNVPAEYQRSYKNQQYRKQMMNQQGYNHQLNNYYNPYINNNL